MCEAELQAIRILVVDDLPIVREGLQSMLSRADDLEVIGEAATGQEAVKQVEALQPDIVLLDIHLPDLDGLTVLRQLKVMQPFPRVLIVTMHEDVTMINQAIDAGAVGYVLKGIRRRDLIATIRMAVASDVIPVPFLIGKEALQIDGTERPSARAEQLETSLRATDQELLQLLADGLNNKAISSQMKWSLATVKKHIQHLFAVLKVSDRTQAVATALRKGLIR